MMRLAASLLAVLMVAAPAAAQSPKVEVTLGTVITGRASAGDVDATLIDTGGNPLTLFKTSNRITPGIGIEGAVSLRLRPRLRLEVAGSWVNADLESRVSGDFEGAPPITATSGLHQFAADASVIRQFTRRGRWDPFVRAGAGWLREMTSDRALVENGLSVNVGGGIKYWVRESQPGLFGRLALRVDVRLAARRGGITFGDAGTRLTPVFAAGIVFGR
jgi:hypothetical protein